jgi:uncharacterized protein YdeI (YjbR/CyaY-like superfamily)
MGAAAKLPGGVVHELPADLRSLLGSDARAGATWQDITPLARNEFICWIESAKAQATRERRIAIALDKLASGQRRPCCWPGCTHREKNSRV